MFWKKSLRLTKKAFIWYKTVQNSSCDGEVEFSASLLRSSESRDPSEIILICWFGALRNICIIINVKNSSADEYLCGNRDTFYFQDSLINVKIKRTLFI